MDRNRDASCAFRYRPGTRVAHNCGQLGISLDTADAVVLSHGHYDHTCGPESIFRRPDRIPDDQALFLETALGMLVLLGCAHAGVINTLRYVQQLTDNRPLYGVIGGMHLNAAGPERVEQTLDALRVPGVKRLIPCHCTGFAAMARLWQAFGDWCTPPATGTVIDTNTW